EYAVRAHDPATATQGGPWRCPAGAGDVELVLASEPETRRVAGRLVTASGVPIPDAWIVGRRGALDGAAAEPPHVANVPLGTRTDADGRFEFPALATRGTMLELQHEWFFIRHVRLDEHDDLEHLELVEPVLCELQIELQDPELAASVVVLDESGAELELLESWGVFLSAGEAASFQDGKTSVLRVKETARTLVLRKDGEDVLRRPLALEPGRLVALRL
ncbi:MAG TPA: hypothetical protein VFM41_13865, partial [Gaiella sp.]|nr:hypothetical protein [Gaiella sp.]